MDRPRAAAWPESGRRRAMRVLPDGVVGEPACGPAGFGGGAVLVWEGPVHAASRRAAVASAKRDERIGAILRRMNAHGRTRPVTS
jgi:hypothetical protein